MLHPECRRRLVQSFRHSSSRKQAATPSFQDFLHSTLTRRYLSSSAPLSSHIGSTPLFIPASVELHIPLAPPTSTITPTARRMASPTIQIKGPLGTLTYPLTPGIRVDYNPSTRKAHVSVVDPTVAHQRAMWGTTRAYLSNHILGVSEGHTTILRLIGVGYRATIENSAITVSPSYDGQQFVSLKVGYSHPIELGVPQGVKASVPQPTRILLEGTEKEVVKEFAAKIRKWRIPEPYKGKGIFVDDETIKLKAKKIK